jgi:hypothetical protein
MMIRHKLYRSLIFLFGSFLSIPLFAQVGLGNSTPKNALEISQTSADPATSGSSSNGTLRVQGNTSSVLDFGILNSASGSWIQSRSSSSYSNNFSLKLNPNGGNVTIGTSTPGSSTLHVSGNIQATGAIRSSSAGQLLNSVYLTESDLGISNTISNNSTTATDVVSYNYTPVSSSSRIWIKLSANYEIAGNTSSGVYDEIGSQITVGGTTIQEKRQIFLTGNSGNGNRSVNIFPISAVYDNTGSSTLTIKVSVKRISGDDLTDVWTDIVFSIVEIAD